MIINKKSNLPAKQNNRNTSMYVFIYYTNNSRFCLGYYDFDSKLWVDGDGMVITNDFLWCYLPVKQMKLFIQNMCNGNLFTRKFNIDGTEYKMFNLEIMGNRVNVATHGLHEKIEEMIGADRYDEVRYIDNLYGYFLPSDVDEANAVAIRESIECVYVG